MSLLAFAIIGGIIASVAFLLLLALGLCYSARDPDYVDVCAGYEPEDWRAHAMTHPVPGGALAMARAEAEAATVPDSEEAS